MATTKIYSVVTGHRVAAGTEWPIQTIVYRVALGQSRPHWVVSEGVCQGVACATHTYRTQRAAFARAIGTEQGKGEGV